DAVKEFFAPTVAVIRGWVTAAQSMMGGSETEETPSPLSPDEQRLARAIDSYDRRLRIFNDTRSNRITLTLTPAAPALAARIANAHVQMYIEDQNAAVGSTLSQMNTSIGARLAQVRERLTASEAALQRYREQNNLMTAVQPPALGAQIQDI